MPGLPVVISAPDDIDDLHFSGRRGLAKVDFR
jgi:hypothetical protein